MYGGGCSKTKVFDNAVPLAYLSNELMWFGKELEVVSHPVPCVIMLADESAHSR